MAKISAALSLVEGCCGTSTGSDVSNGASTSALLLTTSAGVAEGAGVGAQVASSNMV